MKFDDVIVTESLGDWMFGDRAKTGGDIQRSGSKNPGTFTGSVSGGGISSLDKNAYKQFTADFKSDALSSIKAGLNGGLIRAPMAAADQPNSQGPQQPPAPMSETYLKLDNIIESIINEAINTSPRTLAHFMYGWFTKWMRGTDWETTSKQAIKDILNELQDAYDASPNPKKPNIDKNIIAKLANASWSASSIQTTKGFSTQSAVKPAGLDIKTSASRSPTDSDLLNKIEGPINAALTDKIPDGAKVTLSKGRGTAIWSKSYKKWYYEGGSDKGAVPPGLQVRYTKAYLINTSQRKSANAQAVEEVEQAPNNTTFSNDAGSYVVTNGVWVDSATGTPLLDEYANVLNATLKTKPNFFNVNNDEKNSIVNPAPVAESKTKSAIRAEKIPALKTR